MRWPSITELAAELRGWNTNVHGPVYVLLHVWRDGEWRVDVEGYSCGVGGDFIARAQIPGVQNGVVRRFDAKGVARDLLAQVIAPAHPRTNAAVARRPYFWQPGTDDYAPASPPRWFPQSPSRALNGPSWLETYHFSIGGVRFELSGGPGRYSVRTLDVDDWDENSATAAQLTGRVRYAASLDEARRRIRAFKRGDF